MDWQPYGPCCHRHANEAEAGFCPDCGHPFLRCMAFAECHSLVTPTQACPVCVAPALMIDAGAVVQSKAGERLSVPLILRNASPAARPFWVKRIMKWDGRVDEPLALTWEQIESGAERHFTLDTPPVAEGGTHTLRAIFVMASRYKGLEEEYAFATGMAISVSGQDTQQIIQNINLSGAQFQTGGMVNTQLNTRATQGTAPAALHDRTLLSLERAEKYELEQGIRGYQEEGLRVPRHVEFAFHGFLPAECPPDGTTMLLGGRLACGRNARVPDPSANAIPNDLCLRAYQPRGRAVDEPATLAISRHHFDLVILNDRLCVHARSTHGLELNGKPVESGHVEPLAPGDRLVPIPGRPDRLTLQIGFSAAVGSVDRIDISRTPPMAP
jgi:hypothetical protein